MKKIEIIYKNNLLTLNLFSLFFSLNFLFFPFCFKLLCYVWFWKVQRKKMLRKMIFSCLVVL